MQTKDNELRPKWFRANARFRSLHLLPQLEAGLVESSDMEMKFHP